MAPLQLETEPGHIEPPPASPDPPPSGTGRRIASVLLVLTVFGGVVALAWMLQAGPRVSEPLLQPAASPARRTPRPAEPPTTATPELTPTAEAAPLRPPAAPPATDPASAPADRPTADPAPPSADKPAAAAHIAREARPAPETPPAPASDRAAPVPDTVRLELSTRPPGARVVRVKNGNVRCEETPCAVVHPRLEPGTNILLRFEMEGYRSRDVYLPVSEDGHYYFELVPAPAPAPAPTPSPPSDGLVNPFN